MKRDRVALLQRWVVLVFAIGCFSATAVAKWLTVSSDPPDATMEIDGVNVGQTPYSVDLPGGVLLKASHRHGQEA
jgi:hypothetical protein